jgi:ribonuclease P protein subunit RPR2
VADRCRKSHADVARQRRSDLLELAREAALDGRLDDAGRYGELAWRLTTRYQLEASPELKQRVCRNCKAYLLPGETVRVRVEASSVSQTCTSCGRVRRVPVD